MLTFATVSRKPARMSSSHRRSKSSKRRERSGSSRGSRGSGRGSAADESQEYPDPNCDICQGAGTYVKNVTKRVPNTCSACGGNGQSRSGRARELYCCTRQGYDDQPSPDCQFCGGSYGYWNPCERCNGSGQHPTKTHAVTIKEREACDCYGNY